jgi:predicted regulator of Ras-like GTPase activity (Roadblock/LC7/MglB family)
MTDAYTASRSYRLDRALQDLLTSTPEIEAAAVVSFDGLPMASALPPSMDEDRVAAMSAALLSLGDRAAQGLGRGELSQVYIEGESGTVFLVSAEDEAVLVAVAVKGAKAGMMLYEVRRAAGVVAGVLKAEDEPPAPVAAAHAAPAIPAQAPLSAVPDYGSLAPSPTYSAPRSVPSESTWSSSYAVPGSVMPSPPTAPTWT